MKRLIYFLVIICCATSCKDSGANTEQSWDIKDGYIPDKPTAIAVAVAVGERIYGKEEIDNEKPFKASLSSTGIWIVEGTHVEALGGVLHVELQKSDGKIIYVIHGK